MNYEKLASEALNCEQVICLRHITKIVESEDDLENEPVTREELIESKLFDMYDQYIDVDKCYGKNIVGGLNDFFKVDTPLGPVVYMTDNYPLMYIPV